ncbi:MAG: hypothetical protein WC955_00340 [Elusimicrobiota bacterium]
MKTATAVLSALLAVTLANSLCFCEDTYVSKKVLALKWTSSRQTATECKVPKTARKEYTGSYTFAIAPDNKTYFYDLEGNRVMIFNKGNYVDEIKIPFHALVYALCVDPKNQVYVVYKKQDLADPLKMSTMMNIYDQASPGAVISTKLTDSTTAFYAVELDGECNMWLEDGVYRYDVFKSGKFVNAKTRNINKTKVIAQQISYPAEVKVLADKTDPKYQPMISRGIQKHNLPAEFEYAVLTLTSTGAEITGFAKSSDKPKNSK